MSDRAKKRLIIIISILLILVLIILGINLFLDSKLNRMHRTEVFTAEEVSAVDNLTYVENIALLGIDEDDGTGRRSDLMKIVSVNWKENNIKITSLQRSNVAYLPVADCYDRLNHAYTRDDVKGALSAINYNYDMNVTKYILFKFDSFSKVVDLLGGIDLELTAEEAYYAGVGNTAGHYHLNGAQALGYSRDRWQDSDYDRMERNNKILNIIVEKFKDQSALDLLNLIEQFLPDIETNLTNNDIKRIMINILRFNFDEIEQHDFPEHDYDSVLTELKIYEGEPQYVLKDFSGEVEKVHAFIYGEEEEYSASARVVAVEKEILKLKVIEDEDIETEEEK